MFSGFGGGKKKPETPSELITQISQDSKQDKTSTSNNSGAGAGYFDSSGLEKAAKAAKDLDNSKNAKEALKLITLQEQTKQKEHEAERARFQAIQQELAIRRVEQEEISASRTLEKQTEHDKYRANYQDELERKRMVENLNAQRKIADEERRKTEESIARQEALRRKTLEHEAELRERTELARVQAEAKGRIIQERENHDLNIEKKKMELREYRETILESIRLAGTTVGNGLQDYLLDRTKLTNTVMTLTAIGFGLSFASVSTKVAGRYIEAKLGKPSLIRETSRFGILSAIRAPISSIKHYFKKVDGENALKRIILEPKLENRLKRLANSTTNTKKNGAPFRHLLLYGPPGTGKTMFAKGLARESGLHYAIMTGGDVAPLGKNAVTEIHRLFDWAESTSKGVLLFVDEADAFLRKRSESNSSEDSRNALNAFLYRTGEASKKIMIVFASNQPEQFDWAINDRIDDMIYFDIPGDAERLRMIQQYLDEYLRNSNSFQGAGSKAIQIDEKIDDEAVETVALNTRGFSGREINKLAIAWQAAAYGTRNAVLDVALFHQVLSEAKASKERKSKWLISDECQESSLISASSRLASA